MCSPIRVYSVRRRVCENREDTLIIYALYITQGVIHHKHTYGCSRETQLQTTRCMQNNERVAVRNPKVTICWPRWERLLEEPSPRQDVSKRGTNSSAVLVCVGPQSYENTVKKNRVNVSVAAFAGQGRMNETNTIWLTLSETFPTSLFTPSLCNSRSQTNLLGFRGSMTLQWCQTWVAKFYI